MDELDQIAKNLDDTLEKLLVIELKKGQTFGQVRRNLLAEKFNLNKTKRLVIDILLIKLEEKMLNSTLK